MRGGKSRHKAGFCFNVQKQAVPDSSCGPFAKKPNVETRIKNHQDSGNSSGHVSNNSTDSKMKGDHGGLCF